MLTNMIPRPSIRKPGAALLALLLLLLQPLLPPGARTVSGVGSVWAASLEYQIKAAFLLNFTRYIEWPKSSGDLNLCVLGPDVFGNALNDVVAGKVVNGRKIVVRRSVSPTEAATCDMAYISLSGTRQIREALKTLESTAVFTVGEDAEFLRLGGMIAFAPHEDKLRFYINASAAEHAGISISSRLKVLGKNLRDEGERLR
jgi:YfiR/HmsC-like